MTRALVVTGTDTDIGKTVVAAGLVGALGADYWKPIQAGLDDETDREAVMRLAPCDATRAHTEIYRLATAASPHRAAALDGIEIDTARLTPPHSARPLVIEGAGGLMVPLTPSELQIDLFARWRFPVVLVASTRLGTINHTLLSIEALRARAPEAPALEKYAQVGRLLSRRGDLARDAAHAALIDILDGWTRTLALPTLSHYGVGEADLPRIVAHSRGSSMKTNPVVLDDAEIAAILAARL